MEKFLIIAAGGTGTRMGGGKIKQFIILAGKPLLMHTISVFHRYDNNIKVILSLPPEFINQWNDLCIEFNFGIDHTIVEGGDTRYHSVKNALGKIHSHGLVAIHDSVRPFVSIETIKKLSRLKINIVYPGHGKSIVDNPEKLVKKSLEIMKKTNPSRYTFSKKTIIG